MRVSVFILWRNSSHYIHDTLFNLECMEKHSDDFNFEYFFYENDSNDETAKELNNWLTREKRHGLVRSENLGAYYPEQHSDTSYERSRKMTYYRNKMLSLGFEFTAKERKLDSEYSIIFDSDINFDEDTFEMLLSYLKDDIAFCTPNVMQNVLCKMCNCGKESYYDSWALQDLYGNPALTWSCNPFAKNVDRESWQKGNPVKVNSAFGGFTLIKSNILNNLAWSTDGDIEHRNFCADIRRFGHIIVIPEIKVYAKVGSSNFTKQDEIIKTQKEALLSLNQGLPNKEDF